MCSRSTLGAPRHPGLRFDHLVRVLICSFSLMKVLLDCFQASTHKHLRKDSTLAILRRRPKKNMSTRTFLSLKSSLAPPPAIHSNADRCCGASIKQNTGRSELESSTGIWSEETENVRKRSCPSIPPAGHSPRVCSCRATDNQRLRDHVPTK